MMADSSPTMIWVTDDQGRTQFVNKAYLEFFDVEPEQMNGFQWKILFIRMGSEDYLDSFLKGVRDRKPFRAEIRVRRADGEWRWLDSLAVPRFSAGGEFFGMIGSSPDITEHKQAISELQEVQKALQAAKQRPGTASPEQDRCTGTSKRRTGKDKQAVE